MEAAPSNGCLYSTKFGVDLSHSFSLSLSADENLTGWGSGTGLSLVLGVGLDCWREWSFFPAGWKADGHVCRAHDKRPFYVQRMQIEEAPLCTDGDPMPGSACGREGREGGEERGVVVKGREGREGCLWHWVPSLCLVGDGAQKRRTERSRSCQVHTQRGGATSLAKRIQRLVTQ